MRIFLVLTLAVTFLPVPLLAQGQQPDIDSGREFVEEFYAWYAPQTLRDQQGFTAAIALRERKTSFSEELFRRLKADLDAQARCGEIIAIDFDPFLDSQDPAEHYVVKEVWNKGNHYWANIYSVGNGVVAKNPDVSPEFSWVHGRWVFEDFRYPVEHGSLLKILRVPLPKCTVPLPGSK